MHTNILRMVSRGWARLFSAMPSDRIRDDGHKLEHRKLNMKKNIFTVGVTDH